MRSMTCSLPDSIYKALEARIKTDNESRDHVVSAALSQYLDRPIHTLFQVSTSAALVEGLYQGAVRVSRLLQHGDFGLGTFIDLDGEMVVLDGVCYQASSNGLVEIVEKSRLIPYAVVTRFNSEFSKNVPEIKNFGQLVSICNGLRASDNVFYAFRIEGGFSLVKTRVMKPVPEGTDLKAAASKQEEFRFDNVDGTLVGLWSPSFAGSFTVPGYHFHFLSTDRRRGGHVLECKLSGVTLCGCAINEMHVSLPETTEFLKADLTHDPQGDLENAERNHDRHGSQRRR